MILPAISVDGIEIHRTPMTADIGAMGPRTPGVWVPMARSRVYLSKLRPSWFTDSEHEVWRVKPDVAGDLLIRSLAYIWPTEGDNWGRTYSVSVLGFIEDDAEEALVRLVDALVRSPGESRTT